MQYVLGGYDRRRDIVDAASEVAEAGIQRDQAARYAENSVNEGIYAPPGQYHVIAAECLRLLVLHAFLDPVHYPLHIFITPRSIVTVVHFTAVREHKIRVLRVLHELHDQVHPLVLVEERELRYGIHVNDDDLLAEVKSAYRRVGIHGVIRFFKVRKRSRRLLYAELYAAKIVLIHIEPDQSA